MIYSEDGILSRLGIRINFAPPDSNNSITSAEWSFTGDTIATFGYGVLQANPALNIQWYNFPSPHIPSNPGSPTFGFNPDLRAALKDAGIDVFPQGNTQLGPQGKYTANGLGKLGRTSWPQFMKVRG